LPRSENGAGCTLCCQVLSILRLIPWAILVFVVLLSAAIFEPVYCMWLCPFKAVTEFPAVRNVETAIQMGVFVALFLGLVVVLPLLD
jgi:ferredoxin-type protein NapH